MPLITRRGPIELTERDVQLLRSLFESRIMTLQHAAVFHFGGSVEAATKRVQKLKAAGVLAERPRRVHQPSVLFLTKHAFTLLIARNALSSYPKIGWPAIERRARVSELTLRHELQVMDVRAAIWKAVAADDRYTIETFCTWPLLYGFRAAPGPGQRDINVRPDGYLCIRETDASGAVSEQTFFLELDRSTETQSTLAAKAACYGDYYRRGGLAARHGHSRDDYQSFPFRVLVVCQNAERRNNAAHRMLLNHPPIRTQVWLTTFDELIADPLGAIWVQPVDYRAAVAGTAFDVHAVETGGTYVRRSEREALVDRTVRKLRLLNVPLPPPLTLKDEETSCTASDS